MYNIFTTSHGVAFDAFRKTNAFERFDNYFASNLEALSHAIGIHCSITGSVVAFRTTTAMQDIARIIAREIVGDADADLLAPVTQEQVESWAEETLDAMHKRLILTSRPSPAFQVSGDRLSLAHMSQGDQLIALLNSLIYDTGMFRPDEWDSETHYARLCNVIELRSQVSDDLADSEELRDILALLIELDAKYNITRIKFVSRERQMHKELVEGEILQDLKSLKSFITRLLNYRDANAEVETLPSRWTQKSFGTPGFMRSERTDRSNVIEMMRKENRPSNAHLKEKTAPRKAATPKTPEAAKRQARNARAKNFFSGLKF